MDSKPKILVFPFDLLSHYTRSLVFVRNYTSTHTVLVKSSSRYAVFEKYNVFIAGDQKVLKGPHIHSLGFVDLTDLLPQVHLLICHGGNGTLNLSYQYNIPFIAFPSILEQEWNALRFQELGAGQMFNRKKSVAEMKVIVSGMLN